jgi:hypothetical protein
LAMRCFSPLGAILFSDASLMGRRTPAEEIPPSGGPAPAGTRLAAASRCAGRGRTPKAFVMDPTHGCCGRKCRYYQRVTTVVAVGADAATA